jgi:hypothetical protein
LRNPTLTSIATRTAEASKHRKNKSGGRAKAEERYGPLKYRDGAPRPEDRHAPQKLGDANNLQSPGYANIHRNDWIRGAGESAEGKPGFDKSKR